MESHEFSDSHCLRIDFSVFNSKIRREKYNFADKTKYSKQVTVFINHLSN